MLCANQVAAVWLRVETALRLLHQTLRRASDGDLNLLITRPARRV
jgi:hypothetical protein